MWTLIKTQLQYHQRSILFSVLGALVISTFFVVMTGEIAKVLKVWQFLILVTSLVITFVVLVIDQKERRQLLWTTLPLPRGQVALGRILLPFLVQGGVSAFAVVSLFATPLFIGGAVPDIGPQALLASQGYALVLAMLMYLAEELSLLLSRWRWAVILFNLLMMAMLFGYSFGEHHWMPLSKSWLGIILSHFVAATMAATSFVLFKRRGNLLIGMNPKSIFPEDWSEGASK